MPHRLTTYDDMFEGQQASFTKTITASDVSHFIAITEDTNPLHVDHAFAERTFFKKPIVHGMLSAGLFSHVVGMLMPGTGGIYRSQTLEFLRPVHVGDTITATMVITRIDADKEIIEMSATIHNQGGEAVICGTASATLLRKVVHHPEETPSPTEE